LAASFFRLFSVYLCSKLLLGTPEKESHLTKLQDAGSFDPLNDVRRRVKGAVYRRTKLSGGGLAS